MNLSTCRSVLLVILLTAEVDTPNALAAEGTDQAVSHQLGPAPHRNAIFCQICGNS
ncbi:hypothetical protein [Desulfoferrobacter suflitae]|uniref:hypothetical protein n=1 Tax=Desulfoferrobacter suflitae TaxID=2865782 RepID=UPI0021645DDE|nr:hypothetical protein [Desulfoferrobacter suflitae]MCK8600358.1 hypothetical protein [Desulfoferrobacter suflitae]